MKIAFLGLGKMGTAIAARLLTQNTVTVWNRSERATKELVEQGAIAATNSAEAVREADIVFTMLVDDAAHEDVLLEQGALDAMHKDAVLITLSTISVAFSEQLLKETESRTLRYVACPVFGRPNLAEQGKLFLIPAGDADSIEKARPVLEVFSRGIQIVGERAPAALAFKLGGNFLIASVIASLSEAAHTASAHQIAPELFLSTINAALFQSPFYEAYAKLLLKAPPQPAATFSLGAKDVRLFRQAAVIGGNDTPLADLLNEYFDAGLAEGRKDEDWASAWYAMSAKTLRPPPVAI